MNVNEMIAATVYSSEAKEVLAALDGKAQAMTTAPGDGPDF